MSWWGAIPAAVMYGAVIRPVRAVARRMPSRAWGPLDRASRAVGRAGAIVVRRWVRGDGTGRGQLGTLLRLTELAEGPLGIRGTNEIVSDELARRTIERCPFAHRIQDFP